MYEIEGYKSIRLLSEHHAIKVFSAFQRETNKGVILKILSKDEMTAERKRSFMFEYHLASINNFEYGQKALLLEETKDYFIMELELLEGTSLKESIFINQLDPAQIVKIAILMCNAILELHDKNILHKDINPSNFILGQNFDVIHLVDYGLSEYVDHSDEDVNFLQLSHGNVYYMAPEQSGRINKSVDFTSDLYSLGVCLYEFFVGTVPFEGNDLQELLYQHVAVLPKEPRSVNPKLDKKISEIILKLISKEQKDRYQSAYGLKKDLEKVLGNFLYPAKYDDFTLAEDDISSIFKLADEIVGRDEAIMLLNKCRISACEHQKGLLSITGVSGIGKSTLIESQAQNFFINRSLYARAKIDQFGAAIPLHAWTRILEGCSKYLFDLSKIKLAKIMAQFEVRLEDDIAVLTQFSPALSRLFTGSKYHNDNRSIVPNNLYTALEVFFTVLSENWASLIFFFDDLQWIDTASMHLMDFLMKKDGLTNILFIVAYQEQKLTKEHPIKKIEDSFGEAAYALDLKELTIDNVTTLLENTLSGKYTDISDLVDIIFKKSNGNPYYIEQFIGKIYDLKYLFFNSKSEAWEWELGNIEEMSATQNVVDLLASKISNLTQATQRFFSDAAILGHEVNHFLLANVFPDRYSEIEIEQALKEALIQQMIFRKQGKYYFAKDTLQETFYKLQKKDVIDLNKEKIADYLIDHNWLDDEKYLFMAVNFLKSKKKVKTKKDLSNLITLSVQCVEVLKSKMAYQEARQYLESIDVGDNILAWSNKEDRKILYGYYFNRATLSYITGSHQSALKFIALLLSHTVGIKERSEIFGLQKQLLATNIKNIKMTLKEGQSLAKTLNVSFPDDTSAQEEAIDKLEKKIDSLSKYVGGLDDLPSMKNKDRKIAMRFLMDFWEVCYYAQDENLMALCELNMVYLTLKYGFTKESAFGYVIHGARLAALKRYDESFSFGFSGVKLTDTLKDKEQLPKVYNLFANYSNPYKRSWRTSIELYEESIKQSQKNGDIVFGIWAVYLQKWAYVFSNTPLGTLHKIYTEDSEFMNASSDEKMIKAYGDMGYFIENLHCQEGSHRKVSQHLRYYKSHDFAPACTWQLLLQALNAVILGDDEKVYDLLDNESLDTRQSIVMFPAAHYPFLFSLGLIAKIKKLRQEDDNKTLKNKLFKQMQTLKELSEASPENFILPMLLVKAEASTLFEDHWESVALYKLAISESKEHKIQLFKALCYERFSDYLKGRDTELSRKMLVQAFREYTNWEAYGKTKRMSDEHGSWLEASRNIRLGYEVISKTSSYNTDQLNIETIFEATKVISSELNSKKLIKKLANIMLSQSNSQELFLVKPKKDGWELILSSHQKNHKSTMRGLPLEILSEVVNTKGMIIVDDLNNSDKFMQIAFFKDNAPRSFLALPLLNNEQEVEMILFAQNHIITGAFSLVHKNVLQYLMRQASIAISNAALVESLEKEIEANVQANKKVTLLSQVVEQSPLMIMITKANAEIVYVNDAFSNITGYSSHEILGLTPSILKSDIQHPFFYKELWKSLSEGKIWQGELINRKKDKSHFYEYQTIAPIYDSQNKITHYVSFKENITQNKEREKLFFMQSRQAQMGEMLSMIAHQWRQPLSAISGISLNNKVLLMLDKADNATMLNGFEKIEDLVVFLSTTIEDFRNFFKPDKEVSEIDIRLLLERSISLLEGVIKSHSITINLDVSESALIKTYDNELVQVIMNIIKNAIDIIIERSLVDGTIDISYKKAKNHHIIEIADNAGGVPKEFMGDIFMPYFSTKKQKQGTGLGLYMSKTIVEDHCKGSLTVRNNGRGASFTIELPVDVLPQLKK